MVKLKGLRRVRQDGKLYVYHRATGARMPDLPENDPAFLDAYLAAEKSAPKQHPGIYRAGTMGDLWLSTIRSDRYKSSSEGYRSILRRNADAILKRGADVPVKQIRERHILADLAPLNPHPANERRKTWRFLMSHAKSLGLILEDPSKNIEKRITPKAKQHPPWTKDDVIAFRAHWGLGTPQRLAFELLHWTGARVTSAVTLGPGNVDHDGWLHFVQSKTDGPVWVRFNRSLPGFVDPDDLEQLHRAIQAVNPQHLV